MFQKGKSGNPNGRPKKSSEEQEVERLAKVKSISAINRLAQWMDGDNPKASVAACLAILERAFGKPRQETHVSGEFNHEHHHYEESVSATTEWLVKAAGRDADSEAPESLPH